MEVVCGLCREAMQAPPSTKMPKLLYCLHSFCLECLTRQSRSGSGTIQCPLCSNKTVLGSSGVNGLPIDFCAAKRIERLSLADTSSTVPCDDCGSTEGGFRCIDCHQNMCSECSGYHRRNKRTREHSIMTLQQFVTHPSSYSIPVAETHCSEHAEEELSIFCETCSQVVCRDCAMTHHPAPTHACSFITNEIQTQREKIEALAAVVESNQNSGELSILTVQSVQENLQARTVALRAQINQTFNLIREAVTRRESEILAEVEEVFKRKNGALTNQNGQLEDMQRDIKHGLEFTRQLLQLGTPIEIITTQPSLVTRLAQLSDLPCAQTPSADHNMFLLSDQPQVLNALSKFGSIVPSLASLCRASGPGVQSAEVHIPASFAIHCSYSAEVLDSQSCRLEVIPKQTDTGIHTDIALAHQEFEVDVRRSEGNSFVCKYTPEIPGSVNLTVLFNGEEIPGSPFTIEIKSKTFSGILVNPPISILDGWTEHLRQDWSETTHITDLDPGKGSYILVAAQRKDDEQILVAAMGSRSVVLNPTTSTNKALPHNGAHWYLVDECGFGFSKSEKILLISADQCQDEPEYRCCFALEHGGGFRAGQLSGVDQPLWKLIYYR